MHNNVQTLYNSCTIKQKMIVSQRGGESLDA